MNIEQLEDRTAVRVAALTQSTSPRALIDLHVEEAFLYLSEKLGKDWDEFPEIPEKQSEKVVIIVSASMASIINDAGGLSRVTQLSESALGYSQSVSLANTVSRWVSAEDIARIAKILGVTEPDSEKADYPVFVTGTYGRDYAICWAHEYGWDGGCTCDIGY